VRAQIAARAEAEADAEARLARSVRKVGIKQRDTERMIAHNLERRRETARTARRRDTAVTYGRKRRRNEGMDVDV
jgi:hypothetical protein